MGLEFEVMVPNVDEKAIRKNDPRELVLAIAEAKMDVLLRRVKEPAVIVTADQVVVCNGQVMEKPKDESEARSFFKCYREQKLAEVINTLVVVNTATGDRATGHDVVRLQFKSFPPELVDQMLKGTDFMLCAGGLRAESPLFEPYIESIEDKEDRLQGLPKKLLIQLFHKVGAADLANRAQI